MTDLKLLHAFIADWQGKGYEKGDTQRFWLGLIHALGVHEPTQHIIFEGQVHHGTTIYMDGYIPSTKVLIEQKSISKDLGKGYTQSDGNYLLVPRVSSEKRKYVPMSFMSPDIIASDAVQIIPNATLFHFGVLTSNVHMAWMRVVCGRLEMRYRYSANIVYNNFPWPGLSGDAGSSGLSGEMRARIEQTAQAILDARANHPECSLADLYDDTTMPPDLRQAHRDNDRAVMLAYGFTPGKTSESDAVAALFQQYQQLTQ